MTSAEKSGRTFSRRELDAWRGFLRVHAAVVPSLDADLRHGHGISLSAYEVLISLEVAEEGRLRMTELSARLLVTQGGVTRIVDRLVSDGLVTRVKCDDDLRGSFAEITQSGRDLVTTIRPHHHEQVRAVFLDLITPEEQEQLGRLWSRFLAHAW
jgi:DNA-binding MarR family transcriptional regulator